MIYYIIWAILAIFIFAIGIIYSIKRYISKSLDKKISSYQNDLMSKQYREVENMYRQVRGWRHDYHNHIQLMKIYLEDNMISELGSYLNELQNDLINVDRVVKTGNVMADAILNSKLSLAKNKSIRVDAKGFIPEKITIASIDICAVLGNILDNAMEGCMTVKNQEERFIRVYIDVLKGKLYISVSNSSGKKVKKIGGKYISTKKGNHGYGLFRVDQIAKKYNGYINRQDEEGVFATEIMFPL